MPAAILKRLQYLKENRGSHGSGFLAMGKSPNGRIPLPFGCEELPTPLLRTPDLYLG
jgi:hypothetical protein